MQQHKGWCWPVNTSLLQSASVWWLHLIDSIGNGVGRGDYSGGRMQTNSSTFVLTTQVTSAEKLMDPCLNWLLYLLTLAVSLWYGGIHYRMISIAYNHIMVDMIQLSTRETIILFCTSVIHGISWKWISWGKNQQIHLLWQREGEERELRWTTRRKKEAEDEGGEEKKKKKKKFVILSTEVFANIWSGSFTF